MEKDVVCGMQVDPAKAAGTSEYNGKTPQHHRRKLGASAGTRQSRMMMFAAPPPSGHLARWT